MKDKKGWKITVISMMDMLASVRDAERAIANLDADERPEDYEDLVAFEEAVKPPLWWLPPRKAN